MWVFYWDLYDHDFLTTYHAVGVMTTRPPIIGTDSRDLSIPIIGGLVELANVVTKSWSNKYSEVRMVLWKN